ncbi:flagellar protein FlaG [Marinomonas algarum]|uniref:Flagellar protein FlaG n=1 Tax=Marinomonas algarum TaxID=2883105 RepID=A0A9X1IQU9_9GAMM|nr:flagellar protein FlaG [Marinomonas algarum]MCB5162861.1 flagellar protein FlaG [Marinomonas algarum]
MTINASDFSKQGVSYSLVRPEQRVSDDFIAQRQENAKVVQDTEGASKTDKDDKSQSDSKVIVEASDIETANQKMAQLNVRLTFEMSEDQKQNIVKVLDQSTGDVVRQIPTEEFLKMSDRIDAIMSQLSDIKGTLVNSEV